MQKFVAAAEVFKGISETDASMSLWEQFATTGLLVEGFENIFMTEC